MKSNGNKVEKIIIEKAKELGASLVGIATVEDLKASPSYEAYTKKPFYEITSSSKALNGAKSTNQYWFGHWFIQTQSPYSIGGA